LPYLFFFGVQTTFLSRQATTLDIVGDLLGVVDRLGRRRSGSLEDVYRLLAAVCAAAC
jgi:hypothetical protein